MLNRDEAKAGERDAFQPPQPLSQASLMQARRDILDLHLADELEEYIVNVVTATRNPGAVADALDGQVLYGASPRASMGIDRAARAHAWLAGRDFVGPEDIQAVAPDVSCVHRLVLSFEAEADGVGPGFDHRGHPGRRRRALMPRLDHTPEDASPVAVTQAGLIRLNAPARAIALDVLRVNSLQTGAYVSHFRGRGMEFDESRPYQPGDDPRSIDWRVTARSTEAYTKLFREERERPVLVVVDLSSSMHFATRGAYKSVVASRAAALLSWAAHHRGDRLGGLIFRRQHTS